MGGRLDRQGKGVTAPALKGGEARPNLVLKEGGVGLHGRGGEAPHRCVS